MPKPVNKPELKQQQDALKSYLETLLLEIGEASDDSDEPAALAPTPETPPATTTPVVKQAATFMSPSRATNAPKPEMPSSTASFPGHDLANDAANAVVPAHLPAWVSYPLQLLTFDIGRNRYAVSLKDLNGILPMPQRLTHVPTKIAWFVGLFRNRDINVKLINLPGLWQPQRAEIANHGVVLLFDEGRFAFMASKVKSIVSVGEGDVQWRQIPGLEGVLCGTLRDNMATLIDLHALIDGLRSGIWAGRSNNRVDNAE